MARRGARCEGQVRRSVIRGPVMRRRGSHRFLVSGTQRGNLARSRRETPSPGAFAHESCPAPRVHDGTTWPCSNSRQRSEGPLHAASSTRSRLSRCPVGAVSRTDSDLAGTAVGPAIDNGAQGSALVHWEVICQSRTLEHTGTAAHERHSLPSGGARAVPGSRAQAAARRSMSAAIDHSARATPNLARRLHVDTVRYSPKPDELAP